MLDLHCHMLPAIDDGAPDLATSLEMARMAHADGIRTVACTPHIYPGMYDNNATGIRAAIAQLQGRLDEEGIGADHADADELAFARRAGLGGDRLVVHGNNKDEAFLRAAAASGAKGSRAPGRQPRHASTATSASQHRMPSAFADASTGSPRAMAPARSSVHRRFV